MHCTLQGTWLSDEGGFFQATPGPAETSAFTPARAGLLTKRQENGLRTNRRGVRSERCQEAGLERPKPLEPRAALNTRRRQSSCRSSRTWIWQPVRSEVQAPPANRDARGSDPAASRSRQVQRDAAPATPIRATRSSRCGSLRAGPACSWSSIYDLFRNLSRRSFAWAACADVMACASRVRMGSISLTHDIRFRSKRLGWHSGMKTES